MVSKMPNVTWPTGTFNDSVREWQHEWFYITEPCGAKWGAAPEFRSGAPLRLTSLLKKGLDWSSSDELLALQTRIKGMEDKDIELVNVVQVMLVRRILPCQHRTCNLWEFVPARHQTLRGFFGSSHKDIWKVLFKSSKSWPDSAEDRGYQLSRPASSVSLSNFSICMTQRKRLTCVHSTFPELDEEGGADLLSGPVARRPGHPTSDEDAGPGILQGAEEDEREGG